MTIPPPQQPPTVASQMTPTAPVTGQIASTAAVGSRVPPRFAEEWTALFQDDRHSLASVSQKPSWLGPVEQENLEEYWGFLLDLAANRSDADVMWSLESQHRAYAATLEPRTRANSDAIERARTVIRDPAANSVPKARTSAVLEALHVMDLAYTKFDDSNNALARDLNAVLRRGKTRRFILESAHMVVVLALFNILFGMVSEATCGWVQRVTGLKLSSKNCSAIWFAATLLLFVAERWLVGPQVDAWIAKRTRRNTESVLHFYFRNRTHLEYELAILETLIAETRGQLATIGIVI